MEKVMSFKMVLLEEVNPPPDVNKPDSIWVDEDQLKYEMGIQFGRWKIVKERVFEDDNDFREHYLD
jgi:hypothetical protein